MNRFYRVVITKQPVGSAVRHKEPAMQGRVIIKVTDSTTAGNYKLFVMDCDDAQHEANLTLSGVEALLEAEAVKLAAQYQPRRTLTRFNPVTLEKGEIEIPGCDLGKFYQKQE